LSFDHPLFLWLLLLAPLDAFLALRREARIGAAFLAFVPPSKRAGARSRRRSLALASIVSAAVFIAAASIALAGPGWGTTSEVVERDGLEVAIVVDVSRSMLARDAPPSIPGVPPSRLAAAVSFARLAMAKAPGVSFSLVAAKGTGLLLVPMTDDFDALDSGLDWAEPGALTRGGTDLGAGIDTALSTFSPLAGKGNLILLLSDGGDLAGRARAAALRARERGVRIVAVGFGGFTPVPVPGEGGKPIVDARGGTVLVAQDAELLDAVARGSGGHYVDSGGASALSLVTGEFAREGSGGARISERPRDRVGLFVDLALVALLFRFGVSLFAQGPPRRREKAGGTR